MARNRSILARLQRVSPRAGALLAALAVAVPLLLSQQLPATLAQDLGSAPVPNVEGLGQPEQGEHGAFRWSSGPVELRLQPLGYPTYVRLHVQGVRSPGEPDAQISLRSGGKDLGLFTLPRAPDEVEVRLPLSEFAAINPQLGITTTLFQPPGDRRTLGVVFYRVEQRSGPGIPSLWPALALIVSGVLTYCAAFMVWRRPLYALAAALTWGLAIGLLNAVARPWLVFYSLYFVVPPLVFIFAFPWLRSLLRGERRAQDAPLPEPTLTERPWPIAVAVTALSLLVMGWHLVAPVLPDSKTPTDNLTWGVAFYGAMPLPIQLLGVAAVAGCLLWAWFAPLRQQDEPLSYGTERGVAGLSGAFRDRWLWLLAGGSLLLFSLFPVQYSEGDSDEFDRKIPIGAIWRERELLDFYFKSKLWLLLRGWFPKPSQVYALVASLSGVLYVAGAWLLGRTIGRTRSEAWLVVLGLLFTGNVLLYFGYVESYNLVQVASLFVIWACWQYVRGRLPFGTVALFATLAPLLHGSALWWGPMVVAALLLRSGQEPDETRWRTARSDLLQGIGVGLSIVLLMGSIMLIDGYDYERLQTGLSEMGGLDGRTMLPLFEAQSPYERYTFLSLPHLGAIAQEQLLTAPMALLTILAVVALAWRGVKRQLRSVAPFAVLVVGAASIFFYSISWNPDLGPRDDWDLLSLPAIPLTLVAVYLLARLPYGRPRRLALTAYLAVSGVHTSAWVLLHVLGIRY
ncbi:MAG: hypothetical protein M3437_12780 [Chloroflexota bacterium]|nr:hypothetical protein [Chloroflexota bacterium]MDQ5865638.1 hypothetical protein [Chloroflexota bacterium]